MCLGLYSPMVICKEEPRCCEIELEYSRMCRSPGCKFGGSHTKVTSGE